jgi:hypothetical protein
MKKLVLVVFAASIGFTACKKDRDCECTTMVNGTTTTTVLKIKNTKTKSEKTCKDRTAGVTTCKLK